MAGMPLNFAIPGEGAVASYDWKELQGDVGYIRYYLGASRKTGPTSEYFLTNQQIASDNEVTTINTQNSGSPQDIDFDITFGNVGTISGTAIFNFITQTSAATSTLDITINIYHVTAAGVETSIGQVILPQQTASKNYKRCAKATLTEKNFVIGDKLRINIVTANTGANIAYIWIDPSGRQTLTETTTSATINSVFSADIPFKINI